MQKKVKVKPSSKQQRIEELEDGSLIVYLKSPPIDGKANAELITLISQKYQVKKSDVIIKLGLSSRHKVVEILTSDI